MLVPSRTWRCRRPPTKGSKTYAGGDEQTSRYGNPEGLTSGQQQTWYASCDFPTIPGYRFKNKFRKRERQVAQREKKSAKLSNINTAGIRGKLSLTIAVLDRGNFSKVAVVVTLHLEVEYLALGRGRLGNQMLVKETLQQKNGIRSATRKSLDYPQYAR